jgi:ribosome maturation factor RimP
MTAEDIEKLLTPLVEQEGGEIVDLQWRREGHQWVLRLFLDTPKGLTLDDCAHYSDRVGAFLDEKDVIEPSYVLEISSPGLDRVVKKDKDFARFAGKPVKVRIKIADNGQRRFAGVLQGLQDDKVAVKVGEAVKLFDRRNIDEVRLDDAAAAELSED